MYQESHPIKQAFKTRLEGNELFKSADYRAALLKYHAVLVALRGVNWPASAAAQTEASTTSSPADSSGEESDDGSTAAQDEENNTGEVEGKGKGKAEQEPAEAPPKTRPDDENMAEQIRQALKNTYLNSAAIYVKQERWTRALESAKAAQKYEEDNPKAKFREGQALIGLGHVLPGKRRLEELQLTNPDPAVKAALAKLAQDEAKRETDKQASFRGMFERDTPASKKEKQVGAAATAPFNFGIGTSAARVVLKKEDGVGHSFNFGMTAKKEDDSDSKPTAPASTAKDDSPTAQVVEDVKNVAIKEEEKPVVKDEQA
ncbi:hypothetical protein JCM9279_003228 [Rhodotorula babjevae]